MAESSAELQRLAPFVLGRARRGVVGSSRYAQRLRSAVLEAARDPQRQAVLISGEPGLEKDNLAALVHYGSAERRRLLVRLNANDLQGSGLSLLDELGSSTLLVSGMDRVNGDVQQRLIAMARGENRDSKDACCSPAKPPSRPSTAWCAPSGFLPCGCAEPTWGTGCGTG